MLFSTETGLPDPSNVHTRQNLHIILTNKALVRSHTMTRVPGPLNFVSPLAQLDNGGSISNSSIQKLSSLCTPEINWNQLHIAPTPQQADARLYYFKKIRREQCTGPTHDTRIAKGQLGKQNCIERERGVEIANLLSVVSVEAMAPPPRERAPPAGHASLIPRWRIEREPACGA